MKRIWLVVVGVFVPAAFLAATATALMQSSSGDTCTTSGSGTAYTLRITVPSGAQQFGFAFGAPGATVTNAVIPGTNGNFSTQNLAAKTTGAWISDTPLTGAPVATLATSGSATGPFTIVPTGPSQSTYFDPVKCTIATGSASMPSVAFTVDQHITYDAAAHVWHLIVSIPGAGTVSALQQKATIGTASSKSVTAKSLVQARRVALKSGGKVTLTLRPTPSGQADLSSSGSIKLELRVTFDSSAAGRSASKVLSLTLRK